MSTFWTSKVFVFQPRGGDFNSAMNTLYIEQIWKVNKILKAALYTY